MDGGTKRRPKTTLNALFMKRVEEEIEAQRATQNQVANRVGAVRQRTLNDILNGADPRLSTVFQVATAIGCQPWELLVEKGVRRETTTTEQFVTVLPQPARALPAKGKSNGKKQGDKRVRRA